MSAKPISKHSAGTQDSRTSSVRENSSSSMRSRNPRLESCCAGCWSPGNTMPSAGRHRPQHRLAIFKGRKTTMPSSFNFSDSRLSKLDGFQVEIDEAHERESEKLNEDGIVVFL